VRKHGQLIGLVVVLACIAGLAAGVAGAEAVASETGEQHCEFPLTVEDNTGETVTVEEEPEEVIALLPSVAQQLWAMDAEEKVTGMPVREWTAYLNGSEERTHVLEFDESAGLSLPNTELIVDMEPDIVLAPNEIPEDSVTELREAGQTVYHYERPASLEELTGTIARTGQLVGECEAATGVIEEMQDTIAMVESAVADEEQPRVFYDSGFGTTLTAGSLQHELLTTAGVENVAAEFDSPEFEPEAVVAADPEWVVTTEGGQLSEFPGYEETTALQEDRIVEVDPNLFNQRGPRYADVIETLAEAFHPEALEQARQEDPADGTDDDPGDGVDDDPADGTDDDPADGTDDDPADDPADGADDDIDDADDDGAGMTVVAALVALSALVATMRRAS